MNRRTPLQLAAGRLAEFRLSQEADGTWKAIPWYEITNELSAVGCVPVVRAATLEALEKACGAERMKRAEAAAAARESGPGHLAEVIALTPYLAEQMADLNAIRDHDGRVPYSADE